MPMDQMSAAHPENSPDEMVEEVDNRGNVTGLVTRKEMRRRGLWHRSVFIAVMSHDSQLLVHKRAEHKDLWPGWWDVAIGGVVAPGEEWDQAAARELSEELGITGETLTHLGRGSYMDKEVKVVASVYTVTTDGPFTFADGEISEAHWVTRDELPVWLGAKDFLPDSVALVLPRLARE
jgi:isopentenyldiphosphate isomerase